MAKRLKNEAGYSLVEVMVAIMILAIAIIPMVGMFDAGLRAAVVGSNYDRARAIAGEELEEIKALPFRIDNPVNTVDSAVEFYKPANGPSPPSGPPAGSTLCSDVGAPFACTVRTAYLNPTTLAEDGSGRTMMSVKVTVTWSGGDYTTTGLISQETR